MARHWTITLRKGIQFHDKWGEFTARDVRHAVFLITQPDSVQTDSSLWRRPPGYYEERLCHRRREESR